MKTSTTTSASLENFFERITGFFSQRAPLKTPSTVVPGPASAPKKDNAETEREKKFEYYSNQAYWDLKTIVKLRRLDNPTELKEKFLRFESFQANLSRLQEFGKDPAEAEEQKTWLCNRLYIECMRAVEGRIEAGKISPFDFKNVLKDPDFQISGMIYPKTDFHNHDRFSDDLDSLREKLEEKAKAQSGAMIKNGFGDFWRGEFSHGWNHLETGILYLFS